MPFLSPFSCDKVYEKFKNQSNSWYAGLFTPRSDEQRTTLSVSPYGNNCFAISVDSYPCKAEGEVIFHKLKLFYPVAMILGMVLFYTADEVGRSILFYYTAGISLGMIMAVFLLLFVVSKFIPQRGVGYAFMFCGSSVALYFFRFIKDQIVKGEFADIKIFYAYFMFAGIISFLYCYYRGPIESARGLDIMRWSLQSVALFMVYYSIRCEKISLAFVLILIATKWISLPAIPHYILTRGWIPYRVQSYFRGPRFITAEEYEKEGVEETAKALKALREYCESPECNTWRTVSRLKSPKRFASFMSDGVDITLEEQQEFDETSFDCMSFLTSDEDSQDELAFGEL
ncbi:Hypothetical predicted protein [Paramuricea clavata]|uniref:Uncharacterized protein n=1 Tax=Paramuricea clavata TaxID=317549 RepID=A0A6S7FUG3_PARCT|nr:Hypothetical predicted protein [Paramuricea clavata]